MGGEGITGKGEGRMTKISLQVEGRTHNFAKGDGQIANFLCEMGKFV